MNVPIHRRLLPSLFACSVALLIVLQDGIIVAQDSVTSEARLLRSQMQKDVLTALLPEKRAYRDQLLGLEKRFAAEQDFAGAIRIQTERQALEKELETIEKELTRLQKKARAAPLPSQIELKSADATVTGAKLDVEKGCLGGWDTGAASASWTLPDLPQGGYEVAIFCTGEGGNVTVKESFYALQGSLKAAPVKPAEQNIGTLRVRDGAGLLTLTVNSPEQCKALRVYAVVLYPSTR